MGVYRKHVYLLIVREISGFPLFIDSSLLSQNPGKVAAYELRTISSIFGCSEFFEYSLEKTWPEEASNQRYFHAGQLRRRLQLLLPRQHEP